MIPHPEALCGSTGCSGIKVVGSALSFSTYFQFPRLTRGILYACEDFIRFRIATYHLLVGLARPIKTFNHFCLILSSCRFLLPSTFFRIPQPVAASRLENLLLFAYSNSADFPPANEILWVFHLLRLLHPHSGSFPF